MTRLVVALLVLSGLVGCTYERETTRAAAGPTVDGRTVVTPGTGPASTKDTRQDVRRPGS